MRLLSASSNAGSVPPGTTTSSAKIRLIISSTYGLVVPRSVPLQHGSFTADKTPHPTASILEGCGGWTVFGGRLRVPLDLTIPTSSFSVGIRSLIFVSTTKGALLGGNGLLAVVIRGPDLCSRKFAEMTNCKKSPFFIWSICATVGVVKCCEQNTSQAPSSFRAMWLPIPKI